GGRVRVGPQREEGKLARLGGGRLGQLLAAVADLHREQPGKGIDVLAALVIPDVGALTLDDDGDRTSGATGFFWLIGGLAGEGAPQGGPGALSQSRGRPGRADRTGIFSGHRVPQL